MSYSILHNAIIWSYQLFFILLLCSCAGCQRSNQQQSGNRLRLEIIYHEKHAIQGVNVTAIDGVQEFIFQNTNEKKSLTIRFPPTQIYMITSNSNTKLERIYWPDFAKRATSISLKPGGRCTFNSSFNLDVVTPQFGFDNAPSIRFDFDLSNKENENKDEIYTGSVVSKSCWDKSQVIILDTKDQQKP
jgi:hypothetical protein